MMRVKGIFSYPALAFLLVMFAFFMSVAVRVEPFTQQTGAQGLEATYHVLWTARALSQSSLDSHFLLPAVTLDPETGNPFKWGAATVESRGGSYVYTSFPPLGFLIPKFLFDWQPEGLDFFTLAILNSLIGLLAAVALGGLARTVVLSVLNDEASRKQAGWVVFAFISIIYLFLRETLVSHGSVYWSHSLAQLPLILGAWMSFRMFQGQRDVLTITALVIACFLYPTLEWTGFIFGFGVSAALIVDWVSRRRHQGSDTPVGFGALAPAFLVLLATVLSGVALIVHFAIAIGFSDLLSALVSRAGARSYTYRAALGLVPGYIVSFGALLPIAVLAAIHIYQGNLLPVRQNRSIYLLLFVVAFPILENLLLVQHAYQFSFDRLKLAVPMLLIVAIYIAQMRLYNKPVYVLVAAYIIISSNLQLFGYDNLYYRPWGATNVANNDLVDKFDRNPRSRCVLLGSNSKVRGYLNLTFNRDIIEQTNIEDLLNIANTDNRYCGVGLIITSHEFADLPTIIRIEIIGRTGQVLQTFGAAY